jgi:hypothetical protein
VTGRGTTRTGADRRSRTERPTITPPALAASWLDEPLLRFAGDGRHVDPKVGVALDGPRSYGTSRHRPCMHLAMIGTAASVARGRGFLIAAAEGVGGDDTHSPFPGCEPGQGYRCTLMFSDGADQTLTATEVRGLMDVRSQRERFEATLALLTAKLALVADSDQPVDCVFVILPDDLVKRCGTADYRYGGTAVHRDLRRAFKAAAMRYRLPTQLFLESTTGMTDTRRHLDHPSEIAWNLFTGLYFKADGLPWSPAAATPGTCYVGVSFFRPLGTSDRLRTSVVQAFDESGEGLVLRGHSFPWDERRQGHSPHLPADQADALIGMVLDRYRSERRQLPRRVVVHKSSVFTAQERDGFQDALRRVAEHDLVSLRQDSNVRLLREGRQPPLRGTHFRVGDRSYLYTTGYLTTLGGYPLGHVPAPLLVADHAGDTAHLDLLREVLLLTKMNWNSAEYAEAKPITLRFSHLVGDILREVPDDQEPQAKYAYYM